LDIECVRGCKNKLKNWLARDPIQPNIWLHVLPMSREHHVWVWFGNHGRFFFGCRHRCCGRCPLLVPQFETTNLKIHTNHKFINLDSVFVCLFVCSFVR
jgi:hypothetical protein